MGKVFGIGLQRTGTTSLHLALERLGYRSMHGVYELWHDPEHSILNEYDAFSDNPIPLMYQRLDQEHPDSKFICTTRDLEAWLKSVEWLFQVGRVEYDWKRTPVIDEVHKAFYGRTDFDVDDFARRFVSYHDEVLEYFDGRSNDLLILNMTPTLGWTEICAFLDVPVPDQPFPRANKKRSIRSVHARLLQFRRKAASARRYLTSTIRQ